MQSAPAFPPAVVAALYVAGYVALDWVSYLHPIVPFAITPWNPPPGLSLALLLAYGMRYAPALIVAAWLAEILVRGTAPLHALIVAAVLAGGYSAVAAFLLHWARLRAGLRTLKDLALLAGCSAVGSIAVAAGYVSLQAASGALAVTDSFGHVVRFWVGDFVGIIVVAPFLLVWGSRIARRQPAHWSWDLALQGLTVPAVLWLIFHLEGLDPAKLFYLLFVPLVWVAARHGIAGATAALLAIQVGLVVGLEVGGHGAGSVYELQLLMTALSVTGLFLGMAVSDGRASQEALQERERQLDHALRMAAGSELASSLAHELNQPLSAAANFVRASSLIAAAAEGDRARLNDALARAVGEIDRAADVVRRLRDFFRTGSGRVEPIDLAALVRTIEAAMRPRFERHGIAFELAAARGAPWVAVDRVQIELVLRNLLNNAVDAVAQSGKGAGSIQVRVVAQSDGFARIAVEDSGPGLAPEIAQHLFEPFKSSKRQGMGLGLAISRSIVEAHGGRLWLEPGARGTTFAFTLPLAEAARAGA